MIKKRSIRISGHETSITLEEEFWDALRNIAQRHGKSLNQIISDIDQARETNNLSSAIRIFVLKTLQESLPE
ncbi:MAG: ribbon-helix-helix domain-containing protein [Alphaproteobacteria bacterium]